MMKAIIYNSHTGFSKQYAYYFSVNTGLPIYTIKEAKKHLNKDDEIIYFSWINANKIVNLKKVKKYNIKYIATVGMSFYSEELINTIKEDNNYENIYYLQGGLRWRMLNTFERIIMKMILKRMKKKYKNGLLKEEELILYDRINYGYENIDLNSLDHLIKWYKDLNEFVS